RRLVVPARELYAGDPNALRHGRRIAFAAVEDSARAGTLAALRSRDFRLLWGGQTVPLARHGALLVALRGRLRDPPGHASPHALSGRARTVRLRLGAARAGVLYRGVGSSVVGALEAGCFVFSAGLLALARPRVLARPASDGTWSEIAAGARYVASVPWLWMTI